MINRYQCDEARPLCERCQRAKLMCHGVEEGDNFIFLDENEYAVGRRKRPRGPNLKTNLISQNILRLSTSNSAKSLSRSIDGGLSIAISLTEPQYPLKIPALDIHLDDQALSYYLRSYVEVPRGLPEMGDGYMKHTSVDCCYSQPQSILSLAIFAVSHATFGRSQKSHAALSAGRIQYSKALIKTNMALRDANEIRHDQVLLAVMLLSFYENSMMEKTSHISIRGILDKGSPGFAHHDGAMAVLNLRRQLKKRTMYSMELDKLVRRQLMRSLLLRSMPLPFWLRDGAEYGEHGIALSLDRYMVRAASARHQASCLSLDPASLSKSDRLAEMAKLRRLSAEAQTLDDLLSTWANDLPPENWYSSHAVQYDDLVETDNMIFNGTVHIYSNVGHAGTWIRYLALRLAVNDIICRNQSTFTSPPGPDTDSPEEAANLRTEQLADDLCASIPYMLGLVEVRHVSAYDTVIVTKVPVSRRIALKANMAFFLCWPLAMTAMLSSLPEQHQHYLRDRLLNVSEIVNDGVLERTATEFFPISHHRRHVR